MSNKRKAPNGMYWCNIMLSTGKGKCVMAEEIGDGIYRAWSNSRLTAALKGWINSTDRPGWRYLDVFEEDLTFFDF